MKTSEVDDAGDSSTTGGCRRWLTAEELTAIEARANAATPGPWRLGTPPMWEVNFPDGEPLRESWYATDARFVAHARTDVPRLLATVRALAQRIADVENLLSVANAQITEVRGVVGARQDEVTAIAVRREHETAKHIAVETAQSLCAAAEEKRDMVAATDDSGCKHYVVTVVRLSLGGAPLPNRGPYVVCLACGWMKLKTGRIPTHRDPPGISAHTFNPLSADIVYPEGAGYVLLDRAGAMTHPAVGT